MDEKTAGTVAGNENLTESPPAPETERTDIPADGNGNRPEGTADTARAPEINESAEHTGTIEPSSDSEAAEPDNTLDLAEPAEAVTDAELTAPADDGKQPKEHAKPENHAKVKENLSLLGNFLSTFFITIIVIIAAALVVVKVSGCYLFTVETGSMTPTYPVNTVVVVKPYNSFEEVQVGDVVTYLMNEEGSTVTHRVVAIDTENEKLTTQGDANESPDGAQVLYGNVVGKVIIGIPKMGSVVKVITAEENRNIIIAIIVVLLGWSIVWDIIKKIRRKMRAKKSGQ